MAGYKLTEEQRGILDDTIVSVVQNGFYGLDAIVGETVRLFIARKESWSIAFARSHDHKRYVKSALVRLKGQKRLTNEPAGRHTQWLPAT
jgi:hypothetical protein